MFTERRYQDVLAVNTAIIRIMGVEDIGVITSVGDQNAVSERRKEMIESGFASEKINEDRIKEKLDEIREFGRKL